MNCYLESTLQNYTAGRQKRESWSSQNSSNDSDTTQQPTDFPTTIEPTNPEPEEEFIPIFFNQLNFTDHQIMLCEGNNQCLFDFAVTGEEEFAMETLASNKKAQETRDILSKSCFHHLLCWYTLKLCFIQTTFHQI